MCDLKSHKLMNLGSFGPASTPSPRRQRLVICIKEEIGLKANVAGSACSISDHWLARMNVGSGGAIR